MKNPVTPAGIEPATFRFVAQHLNHCATAVPSTYRNNLKFHVPSVLSSLHHTVTYKDNSELFVRVQRQEQGNCMINLIYLTMLSVALPPYLITSLNGFYFTKFCIGGILLTL